MVSFGFEMMKMGFLLFWGGFIWDQVVEMVCLKGR